MYEEKLEEQNIFNPYTGPRAEVTPLDSTPRKLGGLFWLVSIVTTLLSILLGLFGSFAIPQFADLFNGVGADLPVSTQFVIDARNYLWLALFAVLALWTVLFRTGFYRNRPSTIISRLFLLLGGTELMVIIGVIVALYNPIFVMGDAI